MVRRGCGLQLCTELEMAMVISERNRIQQIRTALEENGYYDNFRRIGNLNEDMTLQSDSNRIANKFALPVTEECMEIFIPLQEKQLPLPYPFETCLVARVSLPPSKKSLHNSPKSLLKASILKYLAQSICEPQISEMMKHIPLSWERHGNLVVLPSFSFSDHLWKSYLDSLTKTELTKFWVMLSGCLGCERLARDSAVSSDDFRSSNAVLLLGDDGWVDHVENGIHYVFDVTQCMFSSGNITEKLRLAKFDCQGETVVDLYAGIGYFVLPYLVHAGASLVHACEWNHHALQGLKRGLQANKVEDKCVIHNGDNRKAGLTDIADRVNVGLLPSSEDGWPLACAALKKSTGGWLHIHGNVTMDLVGNDDQNTDHLPGSKHSSLEQSKCYSLESWIAYVTRHVQMFLQGNKDRAASWSVEVKHVEHVKSYAPHISHIVLDLECRPRVNRH